VTCDAVVRPSRSEDLEAICRTDPDAGLESTDRVFTSTNESNAHMRHVLEKLGYERSGIVHDLDPGDPELIYSKALRETASCPI
jgi:RimJ/RimL family protein N-acetyltransferase